MGSDMRRREFVTLLGGAAAGWPLVARAQQGERVRRVGIFLPSAADDPAWQARVGAFKQGLGQLGWSIGRNLQIDTRWATTNAAELRKQATELAALAPDVIPGRWHDDPGADAAGDPHGADRVRRRR